MGRRKSEVIPAYLWQKYEHLDIFKDGRRLKALHNLYIIYNNMLINKDRKKIKALIKKYINIDNDFFTQKQFEIEQIDSNRNRSVCIDKAIIKAQEMIPEVWVNPDFRHYMITLYDNSFECFRDYEYSEIFQDVYYRCLDEQEYLWGELKDKNSYLSKQILENFYLYVTYRFYILYRELINEFNIYKSLPKNYLHN